MMALFNLRTLAFGGAAEGVPCRAVFLKLSVLQLDLAVFHETVETESVFVRAVKHHYCVPGREGGREGGCGCVCVEDNKTVVRQKTLQERKSVYKGTLRENSEK